jgi:hypothetical protein
MGPQPPPAHALARPSCNEIPTWLARFRARFPGVSARYLELDPRSLGLVRVYVGCILLLEVARRVPYLDVFYTNRGLLPNHTLLFRPGAEFQFSFFFAASHLHEVIALFLMCAVIFALFTCGHRTRLLHVLSFLCILSVHSRTLIFDDGAEVTTRLLLFWILFLPIGARFSLDALRTRTAVGSTPPETRPAVSLVVLAILLQLAAIYFFNAVHKSGDTWRTGSAVHYVLHQDRIVTWLGLQVREHLTPQLSAIMTHAVVGTEFLLPVLLLSPWKTRLCRRLAIVLGIGLHTSFQLLINLGMFSPAMVGFYLLLLSDRDWEALARIRWLQRLRERGTASPVVRFLRDRELSLVRALPARQDAEHRARPSRRRLAEAREALVLIAVIVLGQQILRENGAVPRFLKPPAPSRVVRALVEYPRLYQGWSMFVPEAPRSDLHFHVDAITIDGRHVDPLNQIASRVATVPLDYIPDRLDHFDSFCDYMLYIDNRRDLHTALKAWISGYHQRTGRANDRIIAFTGYVIEDDSPEPGETKPHNFRRRVAIRSKRR